MAVTNYHTVNSRIRGASTGGVRTDYLTDALGSVVATANSSGTVVNTYRYKPYGERLAKTGVAEDPRFGWTGGVGSRTTNRGVAEQYSSGHYSSSLAIGCGGSTQQGYWSVSWANLDPNPIGIGQDLGKGLADAVDPIVQTPVQRRQRAFQWWMDG